jgi:1-acyl-sn-glycerol-3-phosphate acyltransferase
MTAERNRTDLPAEKSEKKTYPPRNPVLRALQIIYCIYALLLFVAMMFVVLVLVLLCTLLGKERGGNAMYVVMNGWARAWCFCIGMWHREIYEAPVDRSAQYIFVANHISYMDIPAAVLSIHQPVRILGKQEMVKYPIFGLIYRLAAISVDRSSAEGRARSVRALKAALAKHISIFIFPEGTFNETDEPLKDFFDGAFRIAIETGTPIKPILFLDTHRRMHYRGILELTPGITRTVYLPDVPVDGYTMAQVKELRQKVYTMMEDGLRRYQEKYKQNERIAVTK